jgi:MarR family 2-MHQ and catechol resistance regulon transcriptional repressor
MRNEQLDAIGDNLQLFFPFFHRKLMKGGNPHVGKKPAIQQYPVLGMLLRDEELPMSEIGRHLYISKPNMTTLIDKLIEEGKVGRRPDKNDRRIINIAITKKGRDFMKAHKRLVKENIKRNLSCLSDKDLAILCASLETIKDILSKISEDD